MTLRTLTERDRREWKLNQVDPYDRDVCRSSVRSAMRTASQLPGTEPTDVDVTPATALNLYAAADDDFLFYHVWECGAILVK